MPLFKSFTCVHFKRESTWLKAGPGQVKNIIFCTRQLRRIRFDCVAKETMDLWAFLWPIYSD